MLNYPRIQHLLPAFAKSSKRAASAIALSRPRVGHLMPNFAKSPKRAAASVALIAGLAAGPLAGVAATADPTPADHTPAGTSPATAAVNAVTGGSSADKAAPSAAQLLPDGTPDPSTQSVIGLSGAQIDNANTIVATANAKHLPPRAAVIAVATSLQESKLENLGNLGANNDHDSLGLFQQRPSSGWGTPEQLTDPEYATSAFLNALTQVPNWQNLPLTDAAQDVQVSAFGGAYAQWEQQASDIVEAYYNAGSGAHGGSHDNGGGSHDNGGSKANDDSKADKGSKAKDGSKADSGSKADKGSNAKNDSKANNGSKADNGSKAHAG